MENVKARHLLLSDLAKVLPIDVIFSKVKFCQLTGMLESSARSRVPALVRGGFLTECGTQRAKRYIMSEDQRQLMIMTASDYKYLSANRSKGVKFGPRPKREKRETCAVTAEIAAYKIAANDLMMCGKLI